MKIPDVVLQEASETMEQLEGTLVYLGKIGDGRSSDVTFLPNNLHLSEIIRKFATEMMAWCYHNVDKLNRNYGTIGSNS